MSNPETSPENMVLVGRRPVLKDDTENILAWLVCGCLEWQHKISLQARLATEALYVALAEPHFHGWELGTELGEEFCGVFI